MGKFKMGLGLTIAFLTLMWAAGGAGPALGAVGTPGSLGYSGDLTRPPLQFTPAAPSDLKVSNFPGVLPVCLEWKDNSINETGFTIERSIHYSEFTKIGTVGAGATTYTDDSVSNDMDCRYRVCANGSSGNSGYSNEAAWVTVPNNPGDLQGGLDTVDWDVNLYWKGNNFNSAYQIQKETIRDEKTILIESIKLTKGSSSYQDKNVKPGNTYTYFVMAVNQAGYSSGSNKVTIHYLPAPTNVRVTCFPGSPKLSVIWQDNSDNETGFEIEKAYSSKELANIYKVPANTTEFVDDVLTDHLYMYRVNAVGPDGEPSPYSDVCYWYAPPNVPENLQAKAVSGSEVMLSWNDKSEHETGFRIQRKDVKMIALINVGANATSYSDKEVMAGTTYSYTIQAVNTDSGTVSDVSAPVSVTPMNWIKLGEVVADKGGLILPGTQLDTVLQVGSPDMTVNGETREIDPGKGTTPVIVEGRTLIPIGTVIEAYGGTVEWDGSESKVKVVCNGRTVELWINSMNTRVNGENQTTDVAPRIINERTMLPVGFISENLGLKVEWNPATSQVTIKNGN